MGIAWNISCVCGYTNTLFEGEGLLARNTNYILHIFPAQEITAFNRALQAGTVEKYSLWNHISLCQRCHELVSNETLRYIVAGKEYTLSKPCPDCEQTVTPCTPPYNCPKCAGETATRQNTGGMWD